MSDRAVVLSADVWEFTDEKTGEVRKGASVWYVNDYRDDSADGLGFKPTKVTATPEIFDQLRGAQLPAMFDLEFGSRPGAQNKATLTLVRMKHQGDVDLFATPAAKGKTAPATA